MKTQGQKDNTPLPLFKSFTIHEQDPYVKAQTHPLAESKYISQDSFVKTSKNTEKPAYRSTHKKEPRGQAENIEVEGEVADFKKYLHRSGVQTQAARTKTHTRARSKADTERQAMRERLELKILEAQQKLRQIQSTLKKYEDEKSEIMRNSDLRRSSLHSWSKGC